MTATLTTLISFNGSNGHGPVAGLIADANGDLFGTTSSGGANGNGTVFEIVKTAAGYASTPTRWSASTAPMAHSRGRPDRRRQRRPVRHDDPGGGANWRRHGVRDRQDRQRLRQHADHPGQLQRRPTAQPSVGRPDRRRQRQPVRHDRPRAARTKLAARCSRSPRPPAATPARRPRWSASTAPTARAPWAGLIADANGDLFGTTSAGGAERQRHGVRDRQDRHRLRQHPHHPGQLQRRQWRDPLAGLIADANGNLFGTTAAAARKRRRHGVRDRQDRQRLRQHADHPGQLRRHQRRDTQSGSLIADANGNLFGTTIAGRRERRRHGVRDQARPPAATPAPQLHWSASTAPTARIRTAA